LWSFFGVRIFFARVWLTGWPQISGRARINTEALRAKQLTSSARTAARAAAQNRIKNRLSIAIS
jgi:hypothetical protein